MSIYLITELKAKKWGVRRWQNADGSYTKTGRSHRKRLSIIAKSSVRGAALLGTIAGGVSFVDGMLMVLPYTSMPSAIVMAGSWAVKDMMVNALRGGVYGAIAGAIVRDDNE